MNVCMLPVRQGSVRLAKKNYLKIGNYTVLEIAILKAINSQIFDKIFINTDDHELIVIAKKFGIDFYLRSENLASSSASTDQVVLDFFRNNERVEKLFWVNTASPLQTISDIKAFYNLSKKKNWSSGVTVSSHQTHSYWEGKPLNFNWQDKFAKTQDLKKIFCFNYAMMGWDKSMQLSLENGQLFDQSTALLESSQWSNFLLKNEDDMNLIKKLYKIAPDQGYDVN